MKVIRVYDLKKKSGRSIIKKGSSEYEFPVGLLHFCMTCEQGTRYPGFFVPQYPLKDVRITSSLGHSSTFLTNKRQAGLLSIVNTSLSLSSGLLFLRCNPLGAQVPAGSLGTTL